MTSEPELVDEKGLLQPHKVVDYIRNKADLVIATLEDSLQMLCYDENTGVWNPDGEIRLKEHAEKMLASSELLKKQLNVHTMGEIKARMEWITYTDREAFQPPPNKICLKNGVLYVDEGRFGDTHAAIDGFRNAIPVTYDSLATCPTIEKFLTEVMGDQASLFYEVAGYCLRPGNKYQRAIMFVGFGDNGKSTAANLLKTFLGPCNVSSRSLQELCEHRFAVADLDGKLANVYSDIPDRALFQTGTFKMLTGGDSITAEHKFQRSFQLVNGAKLIFSCNILPESKDDSDAFFKRWIIVPFNRTIPPEQQDRDLLAKLTTPQELSGFLNKALAAYKEMESRGSFTGEDDIEGKRAFYQRLSDPISCFIDDCVDFDPDKYTVKQQLFQAFQTYCKEKRYGKVYTQKRFFRDFRDKAGSNYIVDSQINLDAGGTTRILRGVNLRESIAPLAPLAAFSYLTNIQNPMEIKRKNPANPANPAMSQTAISQPKEGSPQ